MRCCFRPPAAHSIPWQQPLQYSSVRLLVAGPANASCSTCRTVRKRWSGADGQPLSFRQQPAWSVGCCVWQYPLPVNMGTIGQHQQHSGLPRHSTATPRPSCSRVSSQLDCCVGPATSSHLSVRGNMKHQRSSSSSRAHSPTRALHYCATSHHNINSSKGPPQHNRATNTLPRCTPPSSLHLPYSNRP